MELSKIIILCIGLGVVAIIIFFGRPKRQGENYQPVFMEGPQDPELTARFRVGEYLSGFPGFSGEASLVSCGITEDNFEFRKGMKGPKIGIIPRKSIKNISVAKEGKKNSVAIRWDNGHNIPYDTVFVFNYKKSEADAVEATENLKAWIKGNAANPAV